MSPRANDDENTDEASQLLNEYDQEGRPSFDTSLRFRRVQRTVYVLCFALIVLAEVGVYLQVPPSNKILEDIICRKYYPGSVSTSPGNRKDERCKSKAVQSELATLRGWTMTFDVIPSILTAIPYGLLADRYGRKPIFVLGILGTLLNMAAYNAICWWSNIFPVRATWLASFFSLIGGGSTVLSSMIFTMIADVTSEAKRSTTFFYLASSVLIGELGASAVSSTMMTRDPWLPMMLGLSCIALSLLIALVLPETLAVLTGSRVPSCFNMTEGETVLESDEICRYRNAHASSSRLAAAALDFMWGSKHIALLLSTILMTTLGRYVSEILLQYVTKRYQWTWARAGLLLSLRAFTGLILLTAILPGISHLLVSRLSLAARAKDLWLVRASAIFCALGTLCIGVSGTPVVMVFGVVVWALGSGYNLLIRSLLTSIVEPHRVGMLYNTMAVLETIGSLVAGPLLSFSFRQAMGLGDAWIGLPFIKAGILFTMAAAVVCSVKLAPALERRSKTKTAEMGRRADDEMDGGV